MLNDENRLASENNDKLHHRFYSADPMRRKLFLHSVFRGDALSFFMCMQQYAFLAA